LLLNEKKQENLENLKAKLDPETSSSDPVATLLHKHEQAAEEQEKEALGKKRIKKGKEASEKKDNGKRMRAGGFDTGIPDHFQ